MSGRRGVVGWSRLGIALAVVLAGLTGGTAGASPVANDDIEDASLLSDGYMAVVDVTDATSQTGEVCCDDSNYPVNSPSLRTVWWRYTAATDAVLEFRAADGTTDSGEIDLYRVDGPGIVGLGERINWAWVNHPDRQPDPGRIRFRPTVGTSYAFRYVVNVPASVTATFSILPDSALPTNDDFSQAEPVAVGGSSPPVDVRTGSTETGEPNPCEFHGLCGGPVGASLWWKLEPTADADLHVSGPSQIFDATGPGIGGLEPVFSQFAFNAQQYHFDLHVQAGHTYYLYAWDSRMSPMPSVTVSVSEFGSPPPNDDFDTPTLLSSGVDPGPVTFTDATSVPGEPGIEEQAKSVWSRWDAVTDASVTLAFGGVLPTMSRVYVADGAGLGGLTEVTAGSDQNAQGGGVHFRAYGGRTYYVQSVFRNGSMGTSSVWPIVGPPRIPFPDWTRQLDADQNSSLQLRDISCPEPDFCAAVGASDEEGQPTYIETWDGSDWTTQPSPSPGSTINFLSSVSCTSATMCVAVGESTNNGGNNYSTLITSWDGSTWTLVPSPNFPNAAINDLNSVSCSSATTCVAVGRGLVNGDGRPLALRWTGGAWSVMSVPSTSSSESFNGVSCADDSNCLAVGSITERWNGSAWSIVANSPTLEDVFCLSATDCMGVGTAPAQTSTVAARWNGSTWTTLASPNPGDAQRRLRSVTCIGPSSCVAVGSAASLVRDGYNDYLIDQPLVEVYDGSSWTAVSAPTPTRLGGGLLTGVACFVDASCVGVGRFNELLQSGPGGFSTQARAFVVRGRIIPDVLPPTATIITPADGAYFLTGQNVNARYECTDGDGIAECAGSVADGAQIDTSTPGTKAFTVRAVDNAGNVSTTASMYTVVDPISVSQTLAPGGGTVSTSPVGGVSMLQPVATTVVSPNGGEVSIEQAPVTTATPSGFVLLGVQTNIVAPLAAAEDPLYFVFDIASDLVPAGLTSTDLSILKDNRLLDDCPGATSVPVGETACVSAREDGVDGTTAMRLTVISVSASRWNLAVGSTTPPEVSVHDASIVGGSVVAGDLQFDVSLSDPAAVPVSVGYHTADGSGHAGADYVGAVGTVAFEPGETHSTVRVRTIATGLGQPNRALSLSLDSPNGVTIRGESAQGTILNNTVGIGDTTAFEGDSGTRVIKFPITLSQPAHERVTVSYRLVGGTATGAAKVSASAGVDFIDLGGKTKTVTFSPSRVTGLTPITKIVSVKIVGDTQGGEGDESFNVMLSAPTGGYVVRRGPGIGTIRDDDGSTAGVKLAIGDGSIVSAMAGKQSLSVPLTLSAPLQTSLVVSYLITPDTATYSAKANQGGDYGRLGGKVTFNAGVTAKAVVVPIWPALTPEADQQFHIAISTSGSGVTLYRAMGTGLIRGS